MTYIDPLIETLSVTYNDIEYSADYYKTPIKITGVIDEVHSNWLVGTTYNTGDYVIVPELKRIYRSTADSNAGNFPLATLNTKWVDYGNINSYNMVASDENIGSQTVGTDGVIEFDFSKSNAITGIDLDFVSVKVLLIKTDTINYLSDFAVGSYSINDAVIENNILYESLENLNTDTPPSNKWIQRDDLVYFDEIILGSDIGCSTYGEYFYTSAKKQTRKLLTGLEWLPSSVLRFDFTGNFKIGTICYNNLKDFGCSLVGSKLRYESSSKISTNEFTGFRTVLRFGKVRLLNVDVLFDADLFGDTVQKIDSVIDKNIIWIPDSGDKFSEAISIGYIENFDVPMDNNEKFKSTARIVGVNK